MDLTGNKSINLSYEGKFQDKPTEFYLMEYDEGGVTYKKVSVGDISAKNSNKIRWIQVRGFTDLESIKILKKKFNIHKLTMGTILDVMARSELLSQGERMAADFNFPRWPKSDQAFHFERIGVIRIMQVNTILTFEENPKTLFDGFEKYIKENRNDIRSKPIDQMLFLVIERILEKYFSTVIHLAEELRDYEANLNEAKVSPKVFNQLHEFKNKILHLVDSIEPIKLAVDKGLRFRVEELEEHSLIHTRIISGHLADILDRLDHLDQRSSNTFELALSLNDFKMNQVMKNLNLYATLFLPLTFIAGVYGMNFKRMPELEWVNGYYFTLGLMVVVAISIIIYFKKERWF